MKTLTLLSLSLLASVPCHLSAQYQAVTHYRTVPQDAAVQAAAADVKESAQDVSTAASNLGSAASGLAADTAHLAGQTARLAKDQAVAAGVYAEQRVEEVGTDVITAIDNFGTTASVSAASQVAQVVKSTTRFVDALLYPAAFTATGYFAYKNHIKPHLPALNETMSTIEANHHSVTVAREAGASLLTGGVLFATVYGLLRCQKVANFLTTNMPQTASLLAHVVGTERKLILNTLEDSSL